jgi:hypothetical protein
MRHSRNAALGEKRGIEEDPEGERSFSEKRRKVAVESLLGTGRPLSGLSHRGACPEKREGRRFSGAAPALGASAGEARLHLGASQASGRTVPGAGERERGASRGEARSGSACGARCYAPAQVDVAAGRNRMRSIPLDGGADGGCAGSWCVD